MPLAADRFEAGRPIRFLPRSHLLQTTAAGLALLLHFCVLVWILQSAGRAPLVTESPVKVTLVAEPARKPLPPFLVARAVAAFRSSELHNPLPTQPMPSLPPLRHSLIRKSRAPLRRREVAPAEAAQPAPPAAQAPEQSDSALANLELAIDRSVRAAASMPAMAKRLHREGRVLVRFSYIDGTAGGATIIKAAEFTLLNDAALQAVRRAAYPAAPEGLHGRRLDCLVWISFTLLPA